MNAYKFVLYLFHFLTPFKDTVQNLCHMRYEFLSISNLGIILQA